MLNPASFHEVLHMTLAAYVATSFAVAAVHAFLRAQIGDHRTGDPGDAAGLRLVADGDGAGEGCDREQSGRSESG